MLFYILMASIVMMAVTAFLSGILGYSLGQAQSIGQFPAYMIIDDEILVKILKNRSTGSFDVACGKKEANSLKVAWKDSVKVLTAEELDLLLESKQE